MPFFPFSFPYVFGEKLVEAQAVTATATPTAVASVTKFAESHLHCVGSTSSSAAKDARVSGSLGIIAVGSGNPARETYSSAYVTAVADTLGDSQEEGFASASSGLIASTSAGISRGQSIDSLLDAQCIQDVDASRLATSAAYLSASATSTGYYGSPTAISPPASELFVETFNFKDEFRWAGWDSGPSVVNGQLVVPVDGGGIYSVGNRNSGDGVLNLNSHQLTVHLVSPPTGSSTALAQFVIRPEFSFPAGDTDAAICIQVLDGNWRFLQLDASGDAVSISSTPYSTGSWVRVRLADGIVYWDVSVDGLFWSNEKDEPVASPGYGASSLAFLSDANGGITTTTAVWDSINSEPRAIQASLIVFANEDASISRGQYADAELASNVDTTGFNRYDARAQSALLLDAFLYSEMVRTLNASVSLGIVHDASAEATEYGVADAEFVMLGEVSADMISDQIISAYANVTHQAAGILSRGQSIDATSANYIYMTAEGFCVYRTGSSLTAWAFPVAVSLRNAKADSEFEAEIGYEVSATEFGIAESELAVTFAASGELQKDQKIDASTYVVVWRAGDGSARRPITASFEASAYGTGTLDEPFLIVSVPRDVRVASVADSPRRSKVDSSDRRALVPANKQKV